MIPIRDDNPTRTFAFVTLALIVANIVVFIHELRLPEAHIEAFFYRYGFVPAEGRIETLFTSMFLHGGWQHIIGNLLFLWISGTTSRTPSATGDSSSSTCCVASPPRARSLRRTRNPRCR
jgi:membrane associated rhomboid family serine protease